MRGVSILLALLTACTGEISDPSMSGSDAGDVSVIDPNRPAEPGDQSASSALGRLSRREFENVMFDVFGVRDAAETYLPEDVLLPFDTDSESKDPSQVFVDGMEALAFNVARDMSADTDWVDGMAGCTPSGAADADCLRSFASNLGLALWRRPLTPAELDAGMMQASAFAIEQDDAYVGARFSIQALLQSPEFVYRVVIGDPVDGEDGLRRLSNHELMIRLAFLIWGTTPDDSMLVRASGEELSDDELFAMADLMLADPRADAQIQMFHTFWLGYRGLRVPAELEDDMLAETDALLSRVLTEEGQAWSSLFTSTESFLSPELASHYGETVAATGWAPYGNVQRAGVLSHGSMSTLR